MRIARVLVRSRHKYAVPSRRQSLGIDQARGPTCLGCH